MSATNAQRLARGLAALALAFTFAAIVISTLGDNRIEPRDALLWAPTLVFAGAGLVIATRRPGHTIGWMFLGVGVFAGLAKLSKVYAEYWIDTGAGPERVGQTAAAYAVIAWIPFILVPATFLLLLFPDGHLLSRRWRPVAWCAAVGIAGVAVTEWLAPGPLEDYPTIENPYGVEIELLDAVNSLTFLMLLGAILGSGTSLVLRFRRARGEQRQQMKWIVLAAAQAAVTIPAMLALHGVLADGVPDAVIILSVLALPVATVVAIVRYRLYDIDVVINRALVYGSLTTTLAGFYVGSVLLLQLALESLTQGSGLAVAASTLAVAALFRPVRIRIQSIVDRRFFRSRYDATQTIAAFGTTLRDEVDLSALTADLQAVVAETMRPAHVSLWLRTQDHS
jgi:hypothetical protein